MPHRFALHGLFSAQHAGSLTGLDLLLILLGTLVAALFSPLGGH